MEKICKNCLFASLQLSRNNFRKSPGFQKPLLQVFRAYAVKDRSSVKKYKHGKLIQEELEDETLFPKYLLSLTSTDESVVHAYSEFVKKAAKMIDVNVTKSFNMPAESKTYKAKRTDPKSVTKEEHFTLKEFKRVIEVTDLTSEKSDIFMEFIMQRLPAGVNIDIDLKRWEMLVDPNHPSLRNESR